MYIKIDPASAASGAFITNVQSWDRALLPAQERLEGLEAAVVLAEIGETDLLLEERLGFVPADDPLLVNALGRRSLMVPQQGATALAAVAADMDHVECAAVQRDLHIVVRGEVDVPQLPVEGLEANKAPFPADCRSGLLHEVRTADAEVLPVALQRDLPNRHRINRLRSGFRASAGSESQAHAGK